MWRGNQRGTSRHCELSLVLLGDLSSRSSSSSSSSSSRRSGSSQHGSSWYGIGMPGEPLMDEGDEEDEDLLL